MNYEQSDQRELAPLISLYNHLDQAIDDKDSVIRLFWNYLPEENVFVAYPQHFQENFETLQLSDSTLNDIMFKLPLEEMKVLYVTIMDNLPSSFGFDAEFNCNLETKNYEKFEEFLAKTMEHHEELVTGMELEFKHGSSQADFWLGVIIGHKEKDEEGQEFTARQSISVVHQFTVFYYFDDEEPPFEEEQPRETLGDLLRKKLGID